MTLIDIHAHLDMLEDQPEITLQKAKAAGVDKILTIGTEPADFAFVLKTAEQFYPDIYCTIGVHPHHGAVLDEATVAFLESNLPKKQVVALGEIGLDYYYQTATPEVQKQAFRRQLEIAEQLQMPVQIHTRDADQDTIQILQDFRGKVRGVIHCFTGSENLARHCLDLGWNISFSGVITFKNAEPLRQICKFVPVDRLHVETDAPFLAPVPKRGQKNTPAFVVHTAELVAKLKDISLEKLAEQTSANARQIFPKIN